MTTAKERLFKAIKNEPGKRRPFICPGGMMNFVTEDLMKIEDTFWPACHSDPEQMAKLAKSAWKNGMLDNIGLPFCMTVESEGFGAAVGLGDLHCEPHVTDYLIDTVSDWKQLQKIDFSNGRAKVVLDALRILTTEKEVPIIGNLTGPISVASSILDPGVFYPELRKKSADAHQLLNFITENLIEFGILQLQAGADIIAISDPSASGEILGPKNFDEFAVRYLNRLHDALKVAFPQSEVIIHICGKMHRVFKELNHLHADTLSFDAIVNVREAKKALPKKRIMGNVSTYALESQDPGRIRALTDGCVQAGVDILAPACGLGVRTPTDNFKAVIQRLVEIEDGSV